MGRTIMAAITANFINSRNDQPSFWGAVSKFVVGWEVSSSVLTILYYAIPFDTIESEDVEYISTKFQITISKKSQILNKENFKQEPFSDLRFPFCLFVIWNFLEIVFWSLEFYVLHYWLR